MQVRIRNLPHVGKTPWRDNSLLRKENRGIGQTLEDPNARKRICRDKHGFCEEECMASPVLGDHGPAAKNIAVK